MTCHEFADFVLAYDSGELDPEARKEFDRHMVDCPPCLTYLETYRETIHLGKESLRTPDHPIPAPPEELVQAILTARKKNH